MNRRKFKIKLPTQWNYPPMKKIVALLFVFTLALCSGIQLHAQAPGLYINEVSQGATGTKEYVELIVVGTPTCYSIPTIDLRGWYLDDNNGAHATGSGTGIAPGTTRFSQNTFWSAIPIGTIIVVYNNGDLNASLPAQDVSMTDGNCRLVVPVSDCALFEKHSTLPSTASAVYPTTGFTPCGLWTTTSMANGDDSFQTVDPAGNVFHAVSWGNNTLNTIIYFAGASGGMVALMTNATTNNINTQANWTRVAVTGNESPGSANNAANQSWICSMNNGCTAPTPINLTMVQTNASCSCTGSATVTATGGFNGCGSGYTYSWAPSGGNAATASNLCAGTYTVTVSDINGCSEVLTVNITSAPPFTVSQTQTNVTCNGGTDGSATVTPTGGTAPFTYAWPSGGTNATETGLAAGTYIVTITDAALCAVTATVTITEPPPVTATQSQVNITCNGACNGSASVVASGGTGTYAYAWFPSGGSAATETGLCAGNYICVINSPAGCAHAQTFTITEPAAITAAPSQTNVSCNGGCDGSATVNAAGGTPGYTYAWLPSGGTNATASSLCAGTYSCTITDANACVHTEVFTITEPAAITATQSQTNATCNGGCNGSATVNASGGTPGYTYSWLPSGGTGATASSLCAGTYSCIITDANACTRTEIFTITEPSAITLTTSTTSATCNNANGSAAVIANGGTPGYTYAWSPSGGNNATANGLAANTYSVTVTDLNGCISSATAIVSNTGAPTATASATNVTCFGGTNGSATVNATGGSPGYTYSWAPAGGTNATATGIGAGNYTVTITDAVGCITSVTVAVSEPAAVTATVSSTPDTCNLQSGTVTAIAGGGVGPYTYLWTSIGETSATVDSLASGSYTVTITDAQGCAATSIATVGTANFPPPVAQIIASGPTTFCAGDSVQLVASGGLTYLWSGGESTSSIYVNAAGTYTVTVSNPCGSDTQTISVNINPLPAAQIISSGPTTFCTGGSDTLYASGGTSYLWSNSSTSSFIVVTTPGVYSVVVTNSCGSAPASITINVLTPPVAQISASGPTTFCQGGNVTLVASGGTSYVWSNSAQTSSVIVTTAGTYTVTASNICGTDTAQVQVTVQPLPVAAITGNTLLCNGESTTLSASGGGTYLWNTSATGSAISVSTQGNYYVIVTNNCGSDTAYMSVSTDVVNADFFADVYTGTAPLPVNFTDNSSSNVISWQWDFGNSASSSSSDPSNIYGSSGTFVVVLTVTNASGCTDTAHAIIIVDDIPSVLTVPNVFTPNADGTNDIFLVETTGLDKYDMTIYDRWGVLVFNTNDPLVSWDGKSTSGVDVADGTYYYVINATGLDTKQYNLAGFLTLLR
jgi:gliding motility-associated-like protein